MGVSRRFLNLIVPGCSPGIKSLRRINLTRQQLFYPETLPLPDGDGSKSAGVRQPALKKMCVPEPSFTFKASNIALKMDCFPLADCKVICMDESGRGFFFDLDTRTVGTLPPLRKPKVPITVFVPKPDLDNDVCHTGDGSSLFLMERMSCGGGVQEGDQFVGFIRNAFFQSWHCRLLTPPPFVLREPCNWNNSSCCYKITAYCVVGGGSHACISVEGVGTYCLDTANHVWSQVGEWTLPFHGKVEYVPELKLWFGLSADTQRLAAADLSTMDSQPQLMGPWKELNPPEEWKECKEPQFVSLGSGRFCIARFFQAGFGDDEDFAVLTGVEVSSQGSGNSKGGGGGGPNVKLQMTPHKSKRVNNTSIEALF